MIFIPKIKRNTNLFKRKSGNFAFRVVDRGKPRLITIHTKDEKKARDIRTSMIRDMIAQGIATFTTDLPEQAGATLTREYVVRFPGLPPECYKTLPAAKQRLKGAIVSGSPSRKDERRSNTKPLKTRP